MLLWKIRYLDRTDKQFKDRYLYLDTRTLDPVARAAVELVAEGRSSRTEREILKYKRLFVEGTVEGIPGDDPDNWDRFSTVGPSEYFEDETGREITHDDMAQILTGSPTARAIPSGAQQHDIDFMLTDPKPVPLAEIALSSEDTRLLGYFVRDLNEMMNSAFMKDGPGTITSSSGFMAPSSNPTLKTPATDEEIRSFVTIFRRLYMEKEPANFQKAVAMFVVALGDHPLSKWVEGTAKQYENHLDAVPDARPFVPPGTCTFTTKRLIDVFLYTRYAHQPDERRQRQFGECLAELSGKQDVLTWMFLTEMWKLTLEIGNAGRIVARWFAAYCAHHGITPDVLNSLRDDHGGLGAAEKEEARRERLFREKVEQLAQGLWEQGGRPAGGPSQFLTAARDQLGRTLQQ